MTECQIVRIQIRTDWSGSELFAKVNSCTLNVREIFLPFNMGARGLNKNWKNVLLNKLVVCISLYICTPTVIFRLKDMLQISKILGRNNKSVGDLPYM